MMLNTVLLQAVPQELGNYIMIGGMVVIFYLFFIRPQQKKQKEQKNFIGGISKGDKIVTIGGIHGKIHSMEDETITLELDKGFKITVERSAISLENTKKVNGETKTK